MKAALSALFSLESFAFDERFPMTSEKFRPLLRFAKGQDVSQQFLDLVRPNMRAEYYAGDQLNANKPVTVVKVDPISNILTLRFDDGTQPFEILAIDERLRPVGFSDQGYHNFLSPDGLNDTIFYWPDYLAASGAEEIPLEFFTNAQKGATIPYVKQHCSQMALKSASSLVGDTSSLEIGMFTEYERTYYSCYAANITRIDADRCRVLLHFGGYDEEDLAMDVEVSLTYWKLHPIGFAAANGRAFQLMKGHQLPFSWETFLKEVNAKPIPFYVYNEAQKGKMTEPLLTTL